jgi:hypothetical protein
MALAPVQVRAGVGWQYAFTDLALILFMISAAGLAKAPAAAAPPAPPISAAPELADPVSLWRPAEGGPDLADWLAQQPRDSRQRLTIVARYAGSDASAASASAASLMKQASGAAGPLRMVIEPGETNEIAAALTWDAAPATNPIAEPEGPQRP